MVTFSALNNRRENWDVNNLPDTGDGFTLGCNLLPWERRGLFNLNTGTKRKSVRNVVFIHDSH